MTQMLDALKQSGFIPTEKEVIKKYEYLDEIRPPFGGDILYHTHEDSYTGTAKEMLQALNYLRASARQVSEGEINQLCPTIWVENPQQKYLEENHDKVKLVDFADKGPMVTRDRFDGKAISVHVNEYYANKSRCAFWFEFDYNVMQVRLCYNSNAMYGDIGVWRFILNRDNHTWRDESYWNDMSVQIKLFEIVKTIIDQFEFIPLYINKQVTFRNSYRTINPNGEWEDHAYPALGYNIMRNDDLMGHLDAWIIQNCSQITREEAIKVMIKPTTFYTIHQSRDNMYNYYLRRYTKWSPRRWI